MRATIKFSAHGKTMTDIVEQVTSTWQEFTEEPFPRESEIIIEEGTELYTAEFTARVKIDIDENES